MRSGTTTRRPKARAFTLIELLVVIAVIGALVAMIAPTVSSARQAAQSAVCTSNLRSLAMAHSCYLQASSGYFFRYRETVADGVLWYWGYEKNGSGAEEGSRHIDTGKAKLAPYFPHSGRMKVCPSVPSDASYFKPKYDLAGYGYAINQQMLYTSTTKRDSQITRPEETVAWADSVQINTWQAPASPSHPMIEEWYYLDNRINSPATFHFRHQMKCHVAFANGTVGELDPYWLDPRVDGLVGRPEPAVPSSMVSYLLRLNK